MSATQSKGKNVDCIISKLKILFQEVVDCIISQVNIFPQELVASIISKVKIFLQEVVDLDDESNTPAEERKLKKNTSLDGAGEADNLKKRSKKILKYRNEDNTDPNEAEENSSLAENHTSQNNHDDKDILPGNIYSLSRRVLCTGCGRKVNPAYGTIFRHPMINVLVCKKCYQYYNSGPFTRDEHGIEEQCRWCGDGGYIICCDKCEKVFCKTCLQRNCGKTYLKSLMNAPDGFKWICIVCNKDKPHKYIQRLRKRCDFVMETLDELQEKKAHFNSKKGKQLSRSVLIRPTTLESISRLNCLSKELGSTGQEFSLSCESPVKETFSKQDLPVELFSESKSDEEKEMVDETENKETEGKENGKNEELDARCDENEKNMVDETEEKETEGKENGKNEELDARSDEMEKEMADKTKKKGIERKENKTNEELDEKSKGEKREPVDHERISLDFAPIANRRLTLQSIDKTNKTVPSEPISEKQARTLTEIALIDDLSNEEITHPKNASGKEASNTGMKVVGESKGKKVSGSAEVDVRPLQSKGQINDMKSAKSSEQETKTESGKKQKLPGKGQSVE